ncbi:MAG: SpoIIE family protein phosphatase [Deltaproteobacteria bacterium]|nr:SpoIIE family protein phosphatase [Candidatus Anaeroferrophillacea bacterium]
MTENGNSAAGNFALLQQANLSVEILDALTEGLYITDRERRIVFWNRAAARITGWQAEQIVGRSCYDDVLCHVDKDDRPLCGKEHCPLHRAMETAQRSTLPIIVFAVKADGGRIPLQVSVAPIRDAAGRVVGGVETFRDMSGVMRDLLRAKEIQKLTHGRLVDDDPRIGIAWRTVPVDIIGGDYHRLERLDADRYAFMVADVMGHGVAAALYTMHLHALWEEMRQHLGEPAVFLGALNRRLCTLLEGDESYAAAVHGVLDLRQGTLTLAGAGGPAVMSFPDAAAPAVREVTGMPLGMIVAAGYESRRWPLHPRDNLLLVTDGALEVRNRDGDMLGIDGLMGLVGERGFPRSEDSLRQLETDMLRWSRHIRFPDDLTMLAISCRLDAGR